MGNKYWCVAGGFLIGGLFVLAIGFLYPPTWSADLELVAALEETVRNQRDTIAAYQRALIGDERDLLSLYDSVKAADRVDIIIDSNEDSGLPVKFTLDCGGSEK